MNAEVKAKWLKALRSGKYKQGQDYLYADGKMCCLGVACDLYAEEEGGVWTRTSRAGIYKFEKSMYAPPVNVQMWMGCGEQDWSLPFTFRSDSNNASIIGLNDSAKLTFSQIADVIEAML